MAAGSRCPPQISRQRLPSDGDGERDAGGGGCAVLQPNPSVLQFAGHRKQYVIRPSFRRPTCYGPRGDEMRLNREMQELIIRFKRGRRSGRRNAYVFFEMNGNRRGEIAIVPQRHDSAANKASPSDPNHGGPSRESLHVRF